MKLPLIIVLCISGLAAVSGLAASEDVAPGDPVEQVYQVLGEPEGYMRFEGVETFYFDRGRVVVTDGVVTEAQLMSEAEAALVRAQEQREDAERRMAAARRKAEGIHRRDAQLESELYYRMTPDEQLAYWKEFQRLYPGVDVSGPYHAALREKEDELEREALARSERERVRALERRVEEAEERARRAEEAARFPGYPVVHTVPAYTHTSYYYPRYRTKAYSFKSAYPYDFYRTPRRAYSHGYSRSRCPPGYSGYYRYGRHGHYRSGGSISFRF